MVTYEFVKLCILLACMGFNKSLLKSLIITKSVMCVSQRLSNVFFNEVPVIRSTIWWPVNTA